MMSHVVVYICRLIAIGIAMVSRNGLYKMLTHMYMTLITLHVVWPYGITVLGFITKVSAHM